MKPSGSVGTLNKILTVLGPVEKEEMGITLSHEHCLFDVSCGFSPQEELSKRKIAEEKLSFENVGYVRYHALENYDNLINMDIELAIEELLHFRAMGGKTVIDASMIGIGRDPEALRKISIATGLNIVMGSGFYIESTMDLQIMDKKSEEDIAEIIINEFKQGVGGTGIKPGIIGEIGCSYPLGINEKKVLRAAGFAQKETGAPLVVHPGRNEDAPFDLVRILEEAGADLSHTSICHIERTLSQAENRYRLAETGCYLEYDLWGEEGYYPESFGVTDVLNDTQRIAEIKELFEKGYGEKILISHDICYKCRYRKFGGHGYAHILSNAVPAMKRRGISDEEIGMMLCRNPSEFFSFRK